MKMSIVKGKINVYYDDKYNIGKFIVIKYGHEEYLQPDDEIYKKLIYKIEPLGGIVSYINEHEKSK